MKIINHSNVHFCPQKGDAVWRGAWANILIVKVERVGKSSSLLLLIYMSIDHHWFKCILSHNEPFQGRFF